MPEFGGTVSVVSGCAGGFFYTLGGFPFDLLKTLHQTQAAGANELRKEPFWNLWRGSFFPLLVGTANGATYFTLMEFSRKFIEERFTLHCSKFKKDFIAGACTGIVYGAVQSFAEVVKVNLQVNRSTQRNSVQFFISSLNREMSGVYLRSFVMSIGLEMLASGVFFASYFHFQEKVFGGSRCGALLSGSVAGVVTWNAVFLLDTARTQAIASGKKGSLSLSIQSLQGRGLRMAYAWGLARATVSDGCSLFAYDSFSKMLRRYTEKF